MLSPMSIPFLKKYLTFLSRIQQAFYTLIPESELAEVHLKLSRVLKRLRLRSAQELDGNGQDDINLFVTCFDFLILLTVQSICNHVNQCLHLVSSAEERIEYASLNNNCAERALMSASFEAALTCINSARQLIAPDLEQLPRTAELARAVYLNLVVSLYRLHS
jgi:hypothetical protein